MRINRLKIKNFRNLADIDLHLLPGTVIVGENRAGKSNLIHALRLVLDPTLSSQDRQLSREDFWDGLSDGSEDWDPMSAREVIEVSVEIVDFDTDPVLVTALGDALTEEEPMRAKLTYRFGPVDDLQHGAGGKPRYRGWIFGGESDELVISNDLRGYLYFVFLHALRNVEADIKSWRKSPLRELLEAAAAAVDDDALKSVQEAMRAANVEINNLAEIKDLGQTISKRMKDMVGEHQALETELAVAPDDPQRLIRGMKIFVDGDARRGLASSSLGAQNVLYLALLELGLKQRLLGNDIAHVLMAIEEPEAHLHPHLQRLMFSELLGGSEKSRTTLVTTHSPHIASVADPRSLVVLRMVDGQVKIAEAHRARLSESEWNDIGRYLDVTRAEMVFARRILLMEGFGEQTLMPGLAAEHGIDLDKMGITVCAVHGTHFESYVKFCDALEIPWSVLTDGDPAQSVTGASRAADLVTALGKSGSPEDHGIFVGDHTFEYDLVNADVANIQVCFRAMKELVKEPSAKKIEGWGNTVPDYETYMGMIKNAGGKGRFAQRLTPETLVLPAHVAKALDYLAIQ